MFSHLDICPAPSWFSPRLASICESFDIELSEKQLFLIQKHAEWVMYWNRRTNLMGKVSWEDLIDVHYLDSLFPARWLPSSGKAFDIGTGAGFPGIPLGILNEGKLNLLLSDVKKKKTSFLKIFLSDAGLQSVMVTDQPWQNVVDLEHSSFDLITVRALKLDIHEVEKIISKGLSPGGSLAMWQGPKASMGNYFARFSSCEVHPYTLVGNRRRILLLIKKL